MKAGEFINKLGDLGTTNNAGINANSPLNETFLDFLYELISYYQRDESCKPTLESGKTQKTEYGQGSAIFISFQGEDNSSCYTKLYGYVDGLKNKYKNVGYEVVGNSVLVFLTPEQQITNTQNKQETKTPTQINWAQFPCVTGATGIVEGKENNQVVYSGSGYVWYGNGSRKEIKTGKITFYECSNGKVVTKSTPPKINPSPPTPSKTNDLSAYNFLDSSIGELTKGLDAEKLTKDFISSVGNVQKEATKNKKLLEQINRIKELLK